MYQMYLAHVASIEARLSYLAPMKEKLFLNLTHIELVYGIFPFTQRLEVFLEDLKAL